MANLSDWLGALGEDAMDTAEAAAAAAAAPGWLALLGEAEGFRAALPFGEPEPPAPPPPPSPDPAESAPDPLALAHDRGYAEGEAAGRAAAAAEAEARAAQQRALRLNFRALDEAARDVLAADLADTVIALCSAVLGEAALDRGGLLARCHAAAQRIGGATEALTLHLHPDDIALLGPEALAGWQVASDPARERGSVVIAGPEGSASDGPAEWRRAIAAAVRG